MSALTRCFWSRTPWRLPPGSEAGTKLSATTGSLPSGPLIGAQVAEIAGRHLGRPVKLLTTRVFMLRLVSLFSKGLRGFMQSTNMATSKSTPLVALHSDFDRLNLRSK
jgi:hypothetical protein